MSVRYIFNGNVIVTGSRVEAVFEKKAFHNLFLFLMEKIFSVQHDLVRYDEKGCKEFYEEVVESNKRGQHLMHGAYDANQFAAGFEAVRQKKKELGIAFDCDYLNA